MVNLFCLTRACCDTCSKCSSCHLNAVEHYMHVLSILSERACDNCGLLAFFSVFYHQQFFSWAPSLSSSSHLHRLRHDRRLATSHFEPLALHPPFLMRWKWRISLLMLHFHACHASRSLANKHWYQWLARKQCHKGCHEICLSCRGIVFSWGYMA